MLQAILLNKAGRSISSNEVHWRELFTASEDSLTSTIFGLLLYLPRDLFWRILLNACYGSGIEQNDNKIDHVEYWPHWNSTNTTNVNYVEPDIFIRTAKFDLIIEAKRYDYDQQSKQQWENELNSYLNQFKEDKKDVYLIAVGGISNEKSETIHLNDLEFKVIKSRWSRILNEIKFLKDDIEKGNIKDVDFDSVLTIINDLIIGFRIHGFAVGEWIENTKLFNLEKINDNSILKFYNNTFKSNLVNWRIEQLANYKIKENSLFFFNLNKYK